jgi:hypothetical protein
MRTILLALFAAACAEAPPVKTTLPVHTLKAPAPITQEGVSLTVDPITYDGWKRHGQIVMHIRWQEIDRNAPVNMMGRGGGGSPSTVTKEDDIALVPLPSLLVLIDNQSGKPLSFAKAHGELTDGARHWPLMDSVGDVQGRVQSDVMGTHNVSENRPLLDGVASAVAQMPIATPKLTVAPGQSWQGYLCFKMDVHDADELNDLLDKAEKLTLSLTGLDGAAASLSVVLQRETLEKAVTCPGDLKKPSITKCKEGS